MSRVTNILLSFSLLEDEEARLADVNESMQEHCGGPLKTASENPAC